MSYLAVYCLKFQLHWDFSWYLVSFSKIKENMEYIIPILFRIIINSWRDWTFKHYLFILCIFYTLKSILDCIPHIWIYRVYRYDSHLYCTLCSLCFLFASLSLLPSTSDCKVTSLIRHTLTSAVNMWQML